MAPTHLPLSKALALDALAAWLEEDAGRLQPRLAQRDTLVRLTALLAAHTPAGTQDLSRDISLNKLNCFMAGAARLLAGIDAVQPWCFAVSFQADPLLLPQPLHHYLTQHILVPSLIRRACLPAAASHGPRLCAT